MKLLREIGITVLIAVGVFALLQLTVQSYTVVMSSMEPNVHDGECIMVNKVTYRSSGPQRGDVIVFDPPFESEYPFIKRVIGLPGDIVEIGDGRVSINGTALEEGEYVNDEPNYTLAAMEVPQDEYFVLGDNRNHSRDSSEGWTVPRDHIVGKAWFVYWPPGELGVVRHYRYSDLQSNADGEQETVVTCSFGVQLG
jgi:signal peptidase I